MIVPLSEEELKRTATALRQANGNAAVAAKLIGIPARTMQARRKILEKRPVPDDIVNETSRPLKIFVLPDCQVKPGVNIDHLAAAGKYVAKKRPDVIVCIGDFSDMPSLSSYDVGKKCYEGRSYSADIAAARAGMKAFMTPIKNEIHECSTKYADANAWNPRMVLTLGNHEDRITRAIDLDRKLEGTIGLNDLGYEKWGWEVHPFLEVVEIAGIMFCHYFISGTMGRAIATASATLSKKHQSTVAGHLQGRQVAYSTRADGSQITSIICGSFYSHDEAYMGNQGNKHWRGVLMLHQAQNGSSDEMFVSLQYLLFKYGKGVK